MYEVELVGEGQVERLMWGGDLFTKIFNVQEEWDAGVGFGMRDMQARFATEEEAKTCFDAVKAIMADSDVPHELALYVLSYDEVERYYDRDGLLDSVSVPA